MPRIKLVFKTNLNELFQAVLACGAIETIFQNFFSSESITVLPGWYPKKTDLYEMFQVQADCYLSKTDPNETTISFCIVYSEHFQTSHMEIFVKIINSYFNKKLHLSSFTRFWIRFSFGIFIIFIIKLNPICANDNQELQNISQSPK